MIELAIHLLHSFGWRPGFLRVFEYITFRVILAALTALVLELLLGHGLIVQLFRRRFRDTGGDHLALSTASKRGTPTGGGVMVLASVLIALILWGRWTNRYFLPAVLSLVYFGALGFFDDWQKVRLKSSLFGLGQAAKTFLQLCYIVPFAVWFVSSANPLPASHRTTLFLPFLKAFALEVGPWVFGAFVVFVFYSIVNSVNITDGMDGLVSVPAALTAGLYGVFAYLLGNAIWSRYLLFTFLPGAGELAVLGGGLVGAMLGFLWFNTYPAEVFMGDTGSLAIGAALATMALMTRQEMLFPIAGGVFVASIATSLIQEKIGLRLGRRIFLRAPLHHAQTYRGIAEPKVVVRYWIVSVVLALAAALSLKLR